MMMYLLGLDPTIALIHWRRHHIVADEQRNWSSNLHLEWKEQTNKTRHFVESLHCYVDYWKTLQLFLQVVVICNYQSPPNTKRLMPFPLLYIYYLKTMYPVWVGCQILDLAPPVPNFVYQYIFGNVKTITIINQAFEPFWNSNHLLPVMVYELSYVFCLDLMSLGKRWCFLFD